MNSRRGFLKLFAAAPLGVAAIGAVPKGEASPAFINEMARVSMPDIRGRMQISPLPRTTYIAINEQTSWIK